MKQIVDKLNKIAKKINENVELSDRDLIIDSLDSITKAYGGTPNDSTLIVDKLDDIYNNIGPAVSGNIEITENGENINVAPYATATVNVSGGDSPLLCTFTVVNETGSEQEMPVTGLQYYVDGYITDPPEVIGNGETVTMVGILNKDVNDVYWYSFIYGGTLSNAVNCEMGTGDYEFNLLPIDHTQPSSVTVTLIA